MTLIPIPLVHFAVAILCLPFFNCPLTLPRTAIQGLYRPNINCITYKTTHSTMTLVLLPLVEHADAIPPLSYSMVYLLPDGLYTGSMQIMSTNKTTHRTMTLMFIPLVEHADAIPPLPFSNRPPPPRRTICKA